MAITAYEDGVRGLVNNNYSRYFYKLKYNKIKDALPRPRGKRIRFVYTLKKEPQRVLFKKKKK